MAKAVHVCTRRAGLQPSIARALAAIGRRLVPDNITPSEPRVIQADGVVAAIFNPVPPVRVDGGSVCLGYLTGGRDRWNVPRSGSPDGSFAVFRSDERYVEALTDVVASRTIWYYADDELFAASTSQRALVALLGNFEFNDRATSWMLATGTLGPDYSWDRRIRMLPGDSTISLDRASWTLDVETRPCRFSPVPRARRDHRTALERALTHTFRSVTPDYSQWALTLSGGCDSRGILYLLKRTSGLRSITWGLESSLRDPGSDATVAAALASRFGLEHQYFATDPSPEPIDAIVTRLIRCGEGRIDALSGYMDGLHLWKRCVEAGIHGILRGDEGFGWGRVSSAADVRGRVGMWLWSDFRNLQPLHEFGVAPQTLPEYLLRSDHESTAAWRDRLYHQFRMPVMLAALNDVKASYVEVANPLVSREVLEVVRSLPDALRTDKTLYREIAQTFGPDIPFARSPAIDTPWSILRAPRMVQFLNDELASLSTCRSLPRELVRYIADRVEQPKPRTAARLARRHGPAWLKALVKTATGPRIDFNVLAFRAVLTARAASMFAEDARSLNDVRPAMFRSMREGPVASGA